MAEGGPPTFGPSEQMRLIAMGRADQVRARWGQKVVWVLGLAVVLGLVGLGAWLITIYFLTEHHLRQAHHHLDQQHFPQAWAQLKKAETFRPRSPKIHLLLARTARRMHKFADADAELRKIRELRGGRDTEEEQLERLMLRAQTGEVEEVFPSLVGYVKEKKPQESLVVEALADGFVAQRLLVPAEEYVDRWVKLNPNNVEALLLQGAFLEYSGGMLEAEASYTRRPELDAGREETRLRLALVCLGQQHDKEALEHFQRLLRQNPNLTGIRLGVIRAHRSLGNLKEARAAVDDYLKSFPDDPQGWQEKGRVAMEEGEYAEAEKWLRRALQDNPHNPEALYSLITCLRRLGRDAETAEPLRKMNQLTQDTKRLEDLFRFKFPSRSKDVSLLYEMGDLSERIGQEEEANRWFARALREDPYHEKTLKAVIARLEKAGEKALAQEFRARLAKE